MKIQNNHERERHCFKLTTMTKMTLALKTRMMVLVLLMLIERMVMASQLFGECVLVCCFGELRVGVLVCWCVGELVSWCVGELVSW